MGNNGSAGVRGDLPVKGQMQRVAPGTLEEPHEDDRTTETKRAAMMNRKGMAYLDSGMHEKALEAFEESLKIRQMLFQEGSAEYAVTLQNSAIALGKLGNNAAADRFQSALKALEAGNLSDTMYADALANEARYMASVGSYTSAIANFDAALQLYDKHGKVSLPSYWEVLHDYARCCLDRGDASKAVVLCGKMEAGAGSDSILLGRTKLMLGKAALKLGDRAQALQHLEHAEEILLRHVPNEPAWLSRQRTQKWRDDIEAVRLVAAKEVTVKK